MATTPTSTDLISSTPGTHREGRTSQRLRTVGGQGGPHQTSSRQNVYYSARLVLSVSFDVEMVWRVKLMNNIQRERFSRSLLWHENLLLILLVHVFVRMRGWGSPQHHLQMEGGLDIPAQCFMTFITWKGSFLGGDYISVESCFCLSWSVQIPLCDPVAYYGM